jgi:hypothetical protein
VCENCLIEYDAASSMPPTPEMSRVAGWIQDLYRQEDGSVGGPLHVVLDDFNVGDAFLTPYEGWDGSAATLSIAERICEGMRSMSLSQRAATVGIAHGYVI